MKRKADHLDGSRWTLARGEHDGHPLLIRYRQFDEAFPREEFPERLNIFWLMSQPDDNGLASEGEAAALQAFEDDLVTSVEGDPIAVLSVVMTCDGQREFVIHACDVFSFLERLNAMPQGSEPFPIKIQQHHDPAWAYFDAVVGDVRPSD